jgi:AAA+ ATPase superfamily predicted ATPase
LAKYGPYRKNNGSYAIQMMFTPVDNNKKELLYIYDNEFPNYNIYEINRNIPILNPDGLYASIDNHFKPFMRRSLKSRKNKKTRRRTRR